MLSTQVQFRVPRSLKTQLWHRSCSIKLAGPLQTMHARAMEAYAREEDKVVSPSAERNKQPILDVLQKTLPASGTVLELAAGTGQHCAHFAQAMPQLTFLPTDCTSDLFGSIHAHTAGMANVLPPAELDATWPSWPPAEPHQPLAAVMCINMTHISPWEATVGLVQGAGRYLKSAGILFIYGPFKVNGQHTSESNAAFDGSLQERNKLWGYRDVADIEKVAADVGLQKVDVVSMPANNFSLIFKKAEH